MRDQQKQRSDILFIRGIEILPAHSEKAALHKGPMPNRHAELKQIVYNTMQQWKKER